MLSPMTSTRSIPASSRREFLRSFASLTGATIIVPYLEPSLAAVGLQAPPPSLKTVSALDQFRAQMGSVPIATTRLGERMVMLYGPGGNVVVLYGPDGKIAVDSFVMPAWQALKTTLDGLDGSPLKMVIDTHWHFDHSDNNANFRKAGAAIVAHENTKKRLSQSHNIAALNLHIDPSPPEALPTETFSRTHSVKANGEEISLSYVPPAHTDTDILVHYTKANVLHMNDLFFNGFYPFIDASTAGNINGMIAASERALKIANAQTRIIPGHGPLSDRAGLEKYRTMLATVRDTVAALKKKGSTLAEVQAAKPTAKFDADWGKGMMQPDAFVALVFDTLT
jgi:cyclase